LFNSENNARGGYNAGSFTKNSNGDPAIMTYIAGSTLSIEWTNQHQCGGDNTHCTIIVQYMCDTNLRDGTNRTNIPIHNEGCENDDCDTDDTYGMHENNTYWKQCYKRQRQNYYVQVDQTLKRQQAHYTRQHPSNGIYGYECTEEREYYPYSHPSPWKDIVIMTDNEENCTYYQENSENSAIRWYCQAPQGYLDKLKATTGSSSINNKKHYPTIPITEETCNLLKFENEDFTWVSTQQELPKPDCIKSPQSKDNHNGNGINGYPNTYKWNINIPVVEGEKCALRIRYNITTGDLPANLTDPNDPDLAENDVITKHIAGFVGLSGIDAAEKRGYVFKKNPEVDIFGNSKLKLQLNIDPEQFGRTFQDRSHAFKVKKRPDNIPEEATIHNIGVRGKRGNIVQVYPAVEYDFVPNDLELKNGQYVHFQWTGSDTNPNNNAGNGPAGTDRSDLFELRNIQFGDSSGKNGDASTSFPKTLADSKNFGFDNIESKKAFAEAAASTYFNSDPMKLEKDGEYNYVCLRNNAFSNRSQKGKILVVSETTSSKDNDNQLRDAMKELKDVEELFAEHIRSYNWKK